MALISRGLLTLLIHSRSNCLFCLGLRNVFCYATFMTQKLQNTGLMAALIAGILLLYFSDAKVPKETVSQLPVSPPEHSELYSFGYNENLSDSLWLRLIQDIDFCDANVQLSVKNVKPPQPDQSGKKCNSHLGWAYRMLDAITTLTPKFRMPYNHGATILSVTVGDAEGAKRIFDRGVENFPADWALQYRSAYHYLYELNDNVKAADLLRMAGKNGAPEWVFSLSARLYTKEGKAELARSVLQSALDADPDSKYAESLKHRLRQLNNIIAGKPEDAGEK